MLPLWKTETMIPAKHYKEILTLIKDEIQSVRITVARKVTNEQINHYLSIGKIIVEKQENERWGKSVVERLAQDLQRDFPNETGYSARNLWNMRGFYARYSKNEFLQQLVAEIPWGHNLLIMSKIKCDAEAQYYIQATSAHGWSRNVLLHQIKADAYHRALSENKTHNFNRALPDYLSEQADEAIKSSYCLDFLGVTDNVKEIELENKMIEKIRDVIMELGTGFAFIGNQYKISLGQKDYYLDLLFYHRKLQCLVAIELKTGEFKPEYAGKLNFYLEVLDDTEKGEHENPSIGILLCASKDSLEVEYALRVSKKPIGIAEYQLTKELPKDLAEFLPKRQDIQQKLI